MAGYVYYALASDLSVIYIGSTVDITKRLDAHKRESAWWKKMFTISIRYYISIEDARSAESRDICRYDPPFNSDSAHDTHAPDPACLGKRCTRLTGNVFGRDNAPKPEPALPEVAVRRLAPASPSERRAWIAAQRRVNPNMSRSEIMAALMRWANIKLRQAQIDVRMVLGPNEG